MKLARGLLVAASAALLVVALNACGGGESQSPDTTPAPELAKRTSARARRGDVVPARGSVSKRDPLVAVMRLR